MKRYQTILAKNLKPGDIIDMSVPWEPVRVKSATTAGAILDGAEYEVLNLLYTDGRTANMSPWTPMRRYNG